MKRGNAVVVIIILLAALAGIFLAYPFGGDIGNYREAAISFLMRTPPRFIALEVSLDGKPAVVGPGESLKIKGDETLVLKSVNANTFFKSYLSADVAGFSKPADMGKPIDTSAIRKQVVNAGIKSIPIEIFYISRQIAKIPLEIEFSEETFIKKFNKARTIDDKITILKNAHAIFPENKFFIENIEALLAKQGDYLGIIAIYKKILTRKPEDSDALQALCKYGTMAGLADESMKSCEKIAGMGKATSATYLRMADASDESGKSDEMIANLKKAYETDKNNEKIIIKLAKAYEGAGDKDKALQLCIEASSFAKQKEILIPVIQNALAKKDYKTAEQVLKRYVSLYPGDKNALAQLAKITGSTGDVKSQVEYYQKAVNLSPNDPVLQYNLAAAYEKAGREKAAIKTYVNVLRLKPADVDATARLAELSIKTGNAKDAYKIYSGLAEKNESTTNLLGLVKASVALKDNLKIIKSSQRFLEKGKDADVACILGGAFEERASKRSGRNRLADLNDAMDAYKLALSINPSSPRALERLPQLKIDVIRLKRDLK